MSVGGGFSYNFNLKPDPAAPGPAPIPISAPAVSDEAALQAAIASLDPQHQNTLQRLMQNVARARANPKRDIVYVSVDPVSSSSDDSDYSDGCSKYKNKCGRMLTRNGGCRKKHRRRKSWCRDSSSDSDSDSDSDDSSRRRVGRPRKHRKIPLNDRAKEERSDDLLDSYKQGLVKCRKAVDTRCAAVECKPLKRAAKIKALRRASRSRTRSRSRLPRAAMVIGAKKTEKKK